MISPSDLRRELDLAPEQEADLPATIAELVDLWERETGRLWNRRVDYVQLLRPDTDRQQTLWLELWPVEAVALVEERACGETAWTALAAADWQLSGTHELVRTSAYWAAEVRVRYTGGVTAAPAGQQAPTPPDVRRALLAQARYAQLRWGADRAHVARVSANQGSTEYLDGECAPVFEAAVERHRRVA